MIDLRGVLILILLIMIIVQNAYAISLEDVRRDVYDAYKELLRVSEAGGNASRLASKLNEALNLLKKAENVTGKEREELLFKAEKLIGDVIKSAPDEIRKGIENSRMRLIMYVFIGVALAVGAFLAITLGQRGLWRIWLKLRGNYVVRIRKGGGKRNSMIVSGEVWAVILAIIVVASIFAVSQAFIAGRVVEPFSELGILGPKMKIGDYPKEVVVGEPINLYIYVGNHMGRPMYYVVLIKLGNKTTPIDPAPLKPIMKFERILLDNATWIFPVTIIIRKPGINQRLIFELWVYNETVGYETYHGRWGQLWINVTKPIS